MYVYIYILCVYFVLSASRWANRAGRAPFIPNCIYINAYNNSEWDAGMGRRGPSADAPCSARAGRRFYIYIYTYI